LTLKTLFPARRKRDVNSSGDFPQEPKEERLKIESGNMLFMFIYHLSTHKAAPLPQQFKKSGMGRLQ
jgi:hypothetical protein